MWPARPGRPRETTPETSMPPSTVSPVSSAPRSRTSATAFDSLMFRWSMGSGGIGDAAKLMGDMFKDFYYAICILVKAGLEAISGLIDNELKKLVEAVVGDEVIEGVGLGPEDVAADVV